MNNLQKNLQKIANVVTDKYKVGKIEIYFSDKISKAPAVYKTIKTKKGNIPYQIVIYNFKEVLKFPSQIVLLLAHELAHHILNQKKNSLKHSIAHGVLEDEIGTYIYKNLRNLLKNQQKGGKNVKI